MEPTDEPPDPNQRALEHLVQAIREDDLLRGALAARLIDCLTAAGEVDDAQLLDLLERG
jgi:hypothetical protein